MGKARTLLEVLGGGMHELHRDELETTLLEPLDDDANESALDTVGLYARADAQSVRVSGRSTRRGRTLTIM